MKTFIVYDLDSKMPVAVGEQVSAETARYCASVATGIFHANLFPEEIDLEKNYLHHRTQPPSQFSNVWETTTSINTSNEKERFP